MTKIDRDNLKLIQSYEKQMTMQQKPGLVSIKFLTGMWHASPYVAANYADCFYLYSNGMFKYNANGGDGTARIISLSGNWRLEGNTLVVKVKSEEYLEGGTIVAPYMSYGSEYVIEDGHYKTIKIKPELELRFPLSRYSAKDTRRDNFYPSLVIGAFRYWKLYENPEDVKD